MSPGRWDSSKVVGAWAFSAVIHSCLCPAALHSPNSVLLWGNQYSQDKVLNDLIGENVKLLWRGICLQSFALGGNYLSILTALITGCVNIPANKQLFNIDQNDGGHQSSLLSDRLWAINLVTSQKSRRTWWINFLSTCYCGSRSCVCSFSSNLERMPVRERSLLCWGAYGHGGTIQNVRLYLQSVLQERDLDWLIRRSGG